MYKTKINIPGLFIALVLSACQQAPTTPIPTPDELAPYYGEPQPAKVIINSKIYDSEIGTTKWITEVQPDGSTAMVIGDAFAIITPTEPIITTSNLSLTLKLPIPINPTELWYALFKVSGQELDLQDSTHGAFRWNPDYKTQTYQEQTHPQLLAEQQLTFSLEPGFYVLEIHAGWGDTLPHTELEADFGFLLKVQE